MPEERDLYEYAVIRLVPRIERGEFINVGLVMLCKKKRWLKMDFSLNPDLLDSFCPTTDPAFVEKNLQAFKEIAQGENKCSPIAQFEVAERFRWLTAVRSSIIQPAPVHTGFTKNPETCFVALFEELVR